MEFGKTWLPNLNKPGMKTEEKVEALNEFLVSFDKQVRHVLSNLDEENLNGDFGKRWKETQKKAEELAKSAETDKGAYVRKVNGVKPDRKTGEVALTASMVGALEGRIYTTLAELMGASRAQDVTGIGVVQEMMDGEAGLLTLNVEGTAAANYCIKRCGVCAVGLRLEGFSRSDITTTTAIASVPLGYRPKTDMLVSGWLVRGGTKTPCTYTVKATGDIYQNCADDGTYTQFEIAGTIFAEEETTDGDN